MGLQDHPRWLINRLESLPDQADPAYESAAGQVWALHDLHAEAEHDTGLRQSLPAMEKQLLRDLVWSRQDTLPTDVLRDIAVIGDSRAAD